MTEELEQYNLNDLCTKINAILPAPVSWECTLDKAYDGRKYPVIKSTDIRFKCGIIADSFKSVRFETFNSRETTEPGYKHGMTICVRAEFLSYGSNAWDYLEAWQLEDDSWVVEKVG